MDKSTHVHLTPRVLENKIIKLRSSPGFQCCLCPACGASLKAHFWCVDQSLTSRWPVADQSLTSRWPVADQSLTSRWPVATVSVFMCMSQHFYIIVKLYLVVSVTRCMFVSVCVTFSDCLYFEYICLFSLYLWSPFYSFMYHSLSFLSICGLLSVVLCLILSLFSLFVVSFL